MRLREWKLKATAWISSTLGSMISYWQPFWTKWESLCKDIGWKATSLKFQATSIVKQNPLISLTALAMHLMRIPWRPYLREPITCLTQKTKLSTTCCMLSSEARLPNLSLKVYILTESYTANPSWLPTAPSQDWVEQAQLISCPRRTHLTKTSRGLSTGLPWWICSACPTQEPSSAPLTLLRTPQLRPYALTTSNFQLYPLWHYMLTRTISHSMDTYLILLTANPSGQ
jgi:hypothetical protein